MKILMHRMIAMIVMLSSSFLFAGEASQLEKATGLQGTYHEDESPLFLRIN